MMTINARNRLLGMIGCLIPSTAALAQWIREVERLPQTLEVRLGGLSNDGRVVTGACRFTTHRSYGFRWTPETGTRHLGVLAGGDRSYGIGVSGDGRVIVGSSTSFVNGVLATVPVVWTANLGMSPMTQMLYTPRAVNIDGTAMAIGSYTALRWTATGGFESLGILENGTLSVPNDISADGRVIVGYGNTDFTSQMAFRWSPETGLVPLGALPGHSRSVAFSTNGDGLVSVGTSSSQSSSGNVARVVRWTQGNAIEDLGPVPAAPVGLLSSIVDVSAAGDVVVVNAIWTAQSGWTEAADYLAAHGIDITGWDALSAQYVSGDGRTFAGIGMRSGNPAAWIASTHALCDSDFDRNGVLTASDVLGFVQAWIEASAVADYDRDGFVTTADLFGWLDGWFAGCR